MVVINFFIRIDLLLFQVYYICIRNLMSTKCIQNVLRNLMKSWLFYVMDWLNVLLNFFFVNITTVLKTKNKLIIFFILVSCQYMYMKSFQKQKRNINDSIFTVKFN